MPELMPLYSARSMTSVNFASPVAESMRQFHIMLPMAAQLSP